MKRQIPVFLVFIFGIFMVFQYFSPHEASEWIYKFLMDWIYIIGIFAMALGIWSLIHVSYDKIKHKRHDWGYSVVTLLALFAMMFFGITGFDENGKWGFYFMTQEGLTNPMFRNFFNYILVPIETTMFSLLAFFIASAAYRAFRARNVLATMLLLSALIVMLRFNPYFGDAFAFYMNKTAAWLLNVPNMAAKRAILIGIGLGMVGTALKVVLGIERGYMGKG
jgi:hypothetical protein